MSDFNDPELEQLLGRAGGSFPDVNLAYEQVQGRVRHARRRRAVVMSGVACSLLFVTALVAANRLGETEPPQIGDRDTLHATFPDDSSDTTTRGTSTDTTGSTTDDSVAQTNNGGTAPRASTPVTPNSNGSGSGPTTSPPTTGAPSPITTVFSGEGGSITVRQQNGALSLVSYTAAAGYSVDIQHSGGDRVEVRFESPSHRTRIRVDLTNGAMSPAIEETDN